MPRSKEPEVVESEEEKEKFRRTTGYITYWTWWKTKSNEMLYHPDKRRLISVSEKKGWKSNLLSRIASKQWKAFTFREKAPYEAEARVFNDHRVWETLSPAEKQEEIEKAYIYLRDKPPPKEKKKPTGEEKKKKKKKDKKKKKGKKAKKEDSETESDIYSDDEIEEIFQPTFTGQEKVEEEEVDEIEDEKAIEKYLKHLLSSKEDANVVFATNLLDDKGEIQYFPHFLDAAGKAIPKKKYEVKPLKSLSEGEQFEYAEIRFSFLGDKDQKLLSRKRK